MYLFAKDFRSLARERLRGFWALSIAVALVAVLLGGSIVNGGVSLELNTDSLGIEEQIPPNATEKEVLAYLEHLLLKFLPILIASGIYAIAVFIIGGAVRVGYCRFLLDQFDRKEPPFATLFSKFRQFGRCFLLQLLTNLIYALCILPTAVLMIFGILMRTYILIIISPIFLVLPILATFRYAMAPFVMAEHPEMRPVECLRASKEMMFGYKGRLFCLEFSFIGWMLLNALTFGIGSLFLTPYMSAAVAAFYRTLNPVPGTPEDADREKAGFDPMDIIADHMMAEAVCQEEIQSQEHALVCGNGGFFIN